MMYSGFLRECFRSSKQQALIPTTSILRILFSSESKDYSGASQGDSNGRSRKNAISEKTALLNSGSRSVPGAYTVGHKAFAMERDPSVSPDWSPGTSRYR